MANLPKQKRDKMKKVIVAAMALGMMVSAANAGVKEVCWFNYESRKTIHNQMY